VLPNDVATADGELRSTSSQVESWARRGVLDIPEPHPVVAHLDSQQGPDLDALLPPSRTWADVLAVALHKASAAIEAEQVFRVTTEIAAFVCRP
jgi:hypothetical protein